MKNMLLSSLACFMLLATGCAKHNTPAPTPPPANNPWPFNPTTGTLTIKPVTGPAYIVTGLTLQIKPAEKPGSPGNYVTAYTFHGQKNATTYVDVNMTVDGVVVATNTPTSILAREADANYSSYYLVGYGQGTLTTTPKGYTAAFSIGNIAGSSLTQ